MVMSSPSSRQNDSPDAKTQLLNAANEYKKSGLKNSVAFFSILILALGAGVFIYPFLQNGLETTRDKQHVLSKGQTRKLVDRAYQTLTSASEISKALDKEKNRVGFLHDTRDKEVLIMVQNSIKQLEINLEAHTETISSSLYQVLLSYQASPRHTSETLDALSRAAADQKEVEKSLWIQGLMNAIKLAKESPKSLEVYIHNSL